ncbi:hypothetical protein OT109_14725 [Phycisphaeraceae bacterium D3-23]
MTTPDTNPPRCALCQRAGLELTRHHLIPRKRHRQPSCKKRFTLEERTGRIAMLCRPCHNTVHATLTEKQLEQHYNTLDDIAAHPDIARFVAWASKQKPGRRIGVHRPRAR